MNYILQLGGTRMATLAMGVLVLSGAMSLSQAENATAGDAGMTFYVNDPTGRNSVVFKSTAPLEDIVGTSSQITGHMNFDPDRPSEGGHGKLTVPVASLDSGIPLRDEHLQSAGWLDAENFPNIEFHIKELRNVTEVRSTPDAWTYDIVAVGDFSLHGVTKNMEVPGRITYLKESEMTAQRLPGHILAARADFTVVLTDFGIAGPAGMGIVGSKVGESIDIEVSVMGSTASEAP